MAVPNISAAQNEVNTGIKESDSEYEQSSEDGKSSTSETRIGRTLFLDHAEPFEGDIEKTVLGGRGKKAKDMPDTIQEEAGDSEQFTDQMRCILDFD